MGFCQSRSRIEGRGLRVKGRGIRVEALNGVAFRGLGSVTRDQSAARVEG